MGPWTTAGHAFNYWQESQHPTIKLEVFAKPGLAISNWTPGGEGWTKVEELIHNSRPDVFLWFQGEADATIGTLGKVYEEALVSLILRIRTVAANPEMPAIIVGLADAPVSPVDYRAGYWTIREAQQEAAVQTGGDFIDTRGLPTGSAFHLNEAGQKALGRRIAEIIGDMV